jgi:hypothetical protein
MTAEEFSQGLHVGIQVLAILLPVLGAFALRDRSRLAKLLASIPQVWAVVEQERRKGHKDARQDPLGRGEELMDERLGPLSTREKTLTRQELQAFHEKLRLPQRTARLFRS